MRCVVKFVEETYKAVQRMTQTSDLQPTNLKSQNAPFDYILCYFY